MKVASVVGARPQFIKASAVTRELRRRPGLTETLIHTGQHYDPGLSQVFFDELEMPTPDANLEVGSGSHAVSTARMLERLEPVLERVDPDWVLVYGDTNSTLAGALVAAKLHLPLAHVEAGLRSFNRRMPEEVNRIVTDSVSDLLLAPTEEAVKNLRNEGHPEARIRLVGDVMFDVALHVRERAARQSRILDRLGLRPRGFILATIHRAENTDDPDRLEAVLRGLQEVASGVPVVFPIHPRTQKALGGKPIGGNGLQVVPPVGYLDMANLEQNARLIVTDSGGVQKEAFFHGVVCVTLRDETEWVELTDLGWNHVVPPRDAAAVAAGIRKGLSAPAGRKASPYGSGDSAKRIVDALASMTG